jgi:BlaI family transcriptional regulator, penicillinase repressor
MSPKFNDPLSPSEWEIMKIVWEKKTCAARDVYLVAGESQGWTPSTVKTMLRRLVEKGHLKTTQVGNSFLYKPSNSAMKMLRQSADALMGRALDGTVAPLLAYMVKRSHLSKEQISELRSLLDEEKDGK